MRSLMVIFLLFCYACVTSGKDNVIFSSKNFVNILTWEPAEPQVPGEKVRYSVSYDSEKEDKKAFEKKAECQNITELFCDLTLETLPVYDVQYIARVFADDKFHGQTKTFKPIAETVLGAPILSITTTTTSLHVKVTMPRGPQNESIGDIFKRLKKGPSEAVTRYSLHITQPLWPARNFENTTGHFDVTLKNDGTEYCGYVVYKPDFEWGRPSSEKAFFCASLSDNPWMVLPWPLMGLAILAAVVLLGVCCAKRYVKDVKNCGSPQSLGTFNHSSKLLQYPGDNISKVVISTVESEKTVYAKIKVKPNVSPAVDGGYGPKNIVFLSWQNDSSLHSMEVGHPVVRYQDDSAQSSDIYGAVAIQDEENQDFHHLRADHADRSRTLLTSHGQGVGECGPVPTLHTTIPLSNLNVFENNEAQPLLLETQRDSDGRLILPMLSFEVQNMFSGTTEALVSPEGKPLLSYLIVPSEKGPSLDSLESSENSDSGMDENTIPTPTHGYCNSHYLPTQQDFPKRCPGFQTSLSSDSGTDDSPYKENWMPSSILNCKNETNNYAFTWSGVREEEEIKF